MKKITSFILACLMAFGVIQNACAIEVVPPAQTAVRYVKANPVTVLVKPAGTKPIDVEKTPLALRFTAADPLVSIGTHCCSYGNDTGNFKVELYQWDTDYATTTKSTPLCSFVSPNVPDSRELFMNLPKGTKAKGDLLVVFCSDGDISDSTGIWRAPVNNAQAEVQGFTDGVEDTEFIIPLSIEMKPEVSYPPMVDAPKKDAYSIINTEDFDFGTSEPTNLTDKKYGNHLMPFGMGRMLGYGQVDFGETSPKGAVLRIQNSGVDSNMGEVQMFLDDPGVNKCIAAFRFTDTIPYSQDTQIEITAQITDEITGVHDVYLLGTAAYPYYISNFWFTKEELPLSEWEQRIADFEPVPDSKIIEDYSSTWTATDMLGRKLPDNTTVGDPKGDRAVGMFYWSWHGQRSIASPADSQGSAKSAGNNQLVMDSYPGDPAEIKNDYNYHRWKDTGYWNESIYGYYSGMDEWVVRKQLELMGAAGVDAIFCDNSNGFRSLTGGYMTLAKVMNDMRHQGAKVPKLAFILPFLNSNGWTVPHLENIYQNMYQPGLYSDCWYYWEGKPLVIAMETAFKDVATNDEQAALHEEITNFFTFRSCEPDYRLGEGERALHKGTKQWSWLQNYPQHTFGKTKDGRVEQISVGVAQNHNGSHIMAMNGKDVFGRSYTYKNKFTQLSETSKYYGYNFEEQWERALEVDPAMVFVTGWNEWTAGNQKFYFSTDNAYPDTFDDEYSRDLEPTKGDFKDSYYYQLVSYIRKYKGAQPIPQATEAKTVDVNGDFAQWENVGPNFIDYTGDVVHRDFEARYINGRNHYSNFTGRNDIVLSKVARDSENMYFYVETAENLTPYTDPAWMRLLINTDRKYATGWEGYDYIINRVNPTENTVTVEKAMADWTFEAAGEGTYKLEGNKMMISIPRSVLGLTNKNLDIEFKWADNNLPAADALPKGDIMAFHTDGDAAPLARYNYHYVEDVSKLKAQEDEHVIPQLTGHDYLRRATVMAINNPKAMMEGNAVFVDENNQDVYPVIVNDKTLLPIRFLSESIGAEVTWIEETATAQITLGTKRIRIQEGSNVMQIDKTKVNLQTPAQTMNDRMYVPLRDIVEALDMQCAWFDPGVILVGTNVFEFSANPDVTDYLERIYNVDIQ